MSTLPVKDSTGKAKGDIALSEKFAVEKGSQAVHQAIVMHHANRRHGTASTKTKGEVAGSGKKPWKQKGLGRARAGYKQSPVWRGGSVAFGPRPHSFRKEMNRKMARLAFAKAFGEKADAGCVVVIDDLKLGTPKTKEIKNVFYTLGIEQKALLIIDHVDENICLAARNLQEIEVAQADNVNTWQVVRYPQIVITRAALEKLEQRVA